MAEQDLIPDELENKYKLSANDFLLRSNGFVLFTIDDNGNLNSIFHILNLNTAECLGLYSYISEKAANQISNFSNIENEENNDDNDNNDDNF